MYTQMHFRDMAKVVNGITDQDLKTKLWVILSEHFAIDNDGFKYDLFRKACGL